jgi:2-polyprenyl-3-methyl-5-hydroxy-6-metoxy-1,4-benzoquinol methylase
MTPKLKYLATCLRKLPSRGTKYCPSCGGANSRVISRKYLVTTLRRCGGCQLLFRAPTTSSAENAAFYQSAYKQGFTSDMPDEATLANLVAARFLGSAKDYSTYLAVLTALGAAPGSRVLDFGCSWGYGSWQLANHGFRVTAFEISQSRCHYARQKLGVEAHDRLESLPTTHFDVFFSAHVLEHVPSVKQVVDLARISLRPGGLFVAFTPNGSEPFRRRDPKAWQKLWNMVHPNFLDDTFYLRLFPAALIASSPYDLDLVKRWDNQTNTRIRTTDQIGRASCKERVYSIV